ncbi:S8 family serine peptidase, partial [Coleofasciculus sp. E1-EBD-02]|uniref:S8 family serine peptidase n=1 Tax=Coleofasciculus sp. E1-EBD-02 TaxID=3068481 RepID=UPI0032F113E5
THVLGIIAAQQDNDIGIDGINDDAPLWVGRAVGSGEWADSLVEFVDTAKESSQPNAVVNLSLDLTQVNSDGSVTTRYEFTPEERAAIEYARQNGVLIVTAAGNDGDVMSVLGQASQEFDNIITVGAAQQVETDTVGASVGAQSLAPSPTYQRAYYSSYGRGLDILAEGGTTENPLVSTVEDSVGTMAGTSVATAKVTGAVSQVWAANPQLSYRQVIEVLKSTATDLAEPGWDAQTGTGLLNLAAAVGLAQVTKPEDYAIPAIDIPETWSGEDVVTPMERAADFDINPIIAAVPSYFKPYAQESIPKILAESQASGVTDIGQIAYILATAQHESHLGRWMEELASGDAYEGRLDLGNTQPGDGRRFKGRGYVQITGRSNYTQWSQRLGIDLVSQPHKASEPAIAVKILVQGMRDGTFTGKKLSDYINGSSRDFRNARRIVNGIDKAAEIAQIAENYFNVLNNSNTTTPQPPPSTSGRRPYVVRPGDTLWVIAQRELNDGNRWREIQKEDGSTFTEAQASRLQVGQTIYLPVKYQTGIGKPVTPPPISNPIINSQIGRSSRAPHLFQEAYSRINGNEFGLTPTKDAYRWGNGWTQEFRDRNGNRVLLMLEDGATKAFSVLGNNLNEYEFMGGAVGRDLDGRRVYLGYPRSDENIFTKDGKRAVWQAFAAENGKARIHNLYGHASVVTWGTIGAFYTDLGGAGHWLGMPTRREYIHSSDTIFSDFQGGRIAYNRNDGRTEALRYDEQPSWWFKGVRKSRQADFNGDGRTDFIRQEKGGWASDDHNSANLYLANGDGTFSKRDLTDDPNSMKGDNGVNLILGDFNGDGRTDFIRQEKGGWASDDHNSANLYLSKGDGTFTKRDLTDDPNSMKGDNGVNLIVGDFNGDGKDDFIRQEKGGWASDDHNSANLYLSKGDGTFTKRDLTDDPNSMKGDNGVNLIVANVQPGNSPFRDPVNESKEVSPKTGRVSSRVGSVPLRFRSEPNTNAQILAQLSVGTTFSILRKLDGGTYYPDNRQDWYEVEVNGQRGYVAAYYVSEESSNGGGKSPANPNYIYKEADYLNTLYQDNVGNIISSEYDWYHKNRYATDSIDGHGVDGKVYALVGGEVIEAKNGKEFFGNKNIWQWAYNGTVAIYNKELNKTFIYWHLAEGSINESIKGKTIAPGTFIGREGNTGYSFGAHTHIEVHNGRANVNMSNPNRPQSPANSGRLHIPTVFQDAVRKGLVKLYK